MRHLIVFILLGHLALMMPTAFAVETAPQAPTQWRQWIVEMKQATRGPFRRIRWFCNDGVILEPKPYACQTHGGGLQHGEWNDKTTKLREAGFLIGNVLAEYGRDSKEVKILRDQLKMILLERFLIQRDDGWISHKARFYRGALQNEDEMRGETALRRKLAKALDPATQDYLLLWETAYWLPGERNANLLTQMRDLATQINEEDESFTELRSRLHGAPGAADAERVRSYASRLGQPALQADYEALAAILEELFKPPAWDSELRQTARQVHQAGLRRSLLQGAENHASLDAGLRLANDSRLLQQIRDGLAAESSVVVRDRLLQTAQIIANDLFAAASELEEGRSVASRARQLEWLRHLARGLYGVGLLSRPEWQQVESSVTRILKPGVTLGQYREGLQYLARVPRWSAQWMKFHFGASVEKLAQIEPLAREFIPARLRGSALAFYGTIIDGLQRDLDALSGGGHRLFGKWVGDGVHALNPGLARGRLLRAEAGQALQKDGIYLLPQTTAELVPVAGIITLDEGNALSHVQLLAANLGIPNVVVAGQWLPLLEKHIGENVVLAISPGGVVRLDSDGPQWDAVFEREQPPSSPLQPNTAKLDLEFREFVSLAKLRARDSGVIVGPKAANLGELKHLFPDAVADGVAIPFGRFRAYLDQPMRGAGSSIYEWLQGWYRYLASLQGEKKTAATTTFLEQIHRWIEQDSPGEAFRHELAAALQDVFGVTLPPLFVRSDTNVEDLPGFTGAGLNLTVPNVVGMDAVIRAIMRVWASPFTKRAFQWRQQRMSNPIEVYPSVLLLRTVTVEKSGVLVTMNRLNGSRDWFSVAVSWGIGGVVQGESAEELLIHRRSGQVARLASATSPTMRVAGPGGGLVKKPAPASDHVLTVDEIEQLRAMVEKVEREFPQFDDQGRPVAADIEFGFREGRMALFQIRPYLLSRSARLSGYLQALDTEGRRNDGRAVDLAAVPGGVQ